MTLRFRTYIEVRFFVFFYKIEKEPKVVMLINLVFCNPVKIHNIEYGKNENHSLKS